jgi:hypothetical protein
MSVYVDNMRAPFGRMIMCHMIADTLEELHSMADQIGVARQWFQRDHYDVCLAKRQAAISAGAIPITMREAARKVAKRRAEARSRRAEKDK